MIQRLLFCCRHCVYWCILILGMSVLFLTLGLAINDLYTVNELSDKSDAMEEIPSFEIDCLQTCMTRYADDRGLQCCDQQTNICVEKLLCKTNYQDLQSTTMEILKSDAFTELMVAAVALIVVIFIPIYQFRKSDPQDTSQKKDIRGSQRKKVHSRSQMGHESLLTEELLRQSDTEGRYQTHSKRHKIGIKKQCQPNQPQSPFSQE